MLGLVALAGVALLALPIAARHPGRTFTVSLLLAMFSAPLERLSGLAQMAVLDEVAPVYAVTTCLLASVYRNQRLRLPFGAALFGVFVLVGCVSAVRLDVPTPIAATGLLGAVKGFLFGVAACQLTLSRATLDRGLRVAFRVMMVVVACVVLNIAMPALWTSLWIEPDAQIAEPLFGYPLVGPFARPAALSRLCVMAALVCMAYLVVRRRSAPVNAMVAFLIFSVLLIGQSKSLLALGVGVGVVLIVLRRRPLALVVASGLGIAVIVAGAPLISGIAEDVARYSADDSARSLLAAGSVELATQEFPLGVGFGRYASPAAAEYYSPYYTQFGFENRFGLAPQSPAFLTDTAWPAILGETGWLGAAAFASALLLMIVRSLAILRRRPSETTRLLALTALLLVLATLVESSSGPVFTSAPAFPLMWVAVGLLTSVVRVAPPDAARAESSLLLNRESGASGKDDGPGLPKGHIRMVKLRTAVWVSSTGSPSGAAPEGLVRGRDSRHQPDTTTGCPSSDESRTI